MEKKNPTKDKKQENGKKDGWVRDKKSAERLGLCRAALGGGVFVCCFFMCRVLLPTLGNKP